MAERMGVLARGTSSGTDPDLPHNQAGVGLNSAWRTGFLVGERRIDHGTFGTTAGTSIWAT
jgi:hypothetical protein